MSNWAKTVLNTAKILKNFSATKPKLTGFSATQGSATKNPDNSGQQPYYYGGGGGGGGSSSPTDKEKKAQENLGSIAGYNAETVKGDFDNANDVYDTADEQSKKLQYIQTVQNKQNATNDWYTQQQKEQSALNQLVDAMGNGMNSSTAYDVADLVARKDDMNDVAVLNAMRKNQQQIDNAYYEAVMANNNSRNEKAAQTEKGLRELYADYAAQSNNIHPDLASDMLDNDNHTLEESPDWLTTEWYDDHKREAVKPETQGLYRPDNAVEDAWAESLLPATENKESSSDQSYQERMAQGYDRRTQ